MIVKESLSAYCSRIEQATSEFLKFRKEVRERTKNENANLGNQKFYALHIDKVNEIVQKHNISEKSLSKICKS
jgi:hypothetical protein